MASHPLLSASRLVVAHRGDRAHAPENTLVAFERALASGADAIELDVHASADGHLVVCHDPSVDRTTDGSGTVEDMPIAALCELDAGRRWSPHDDPEQANGGVHGGATPFAGRGIRIPTLSEVLYAFPATPFIIEAKTMRAGAGITAVVGQHGARNRVLIGSFLPDAVRLARAAGLYTTATQRELVSLLPAAFLRRRTRRLAADALAIPPVYRGFPLPILGYARTAPCPVFVWTVNDVAAAQRYWKGGVCGIITDDPQRMAVA